MRHRSAFTLLELIFGIMIVSIMTVVGTQMISLFYTQYERTIQIHTLQSEVDGVVTLLAKRLTYRIRESAIARNSATGNFVPLREATPNETVFEWLGYDYDGFLGDSNDTDVVMGWSGLVDLDANVTNPAHLRSPASHFVILDEMIQMNTFATSDLNHSAIVFKNDVAGVENGYGWGSDHNHTQVHGVTFENDNILLLDDNVTQRFEHYYLTSSAYAIALLDGNLSLVAHYLPWEGESLVDGDSYMLMEGVTRFEMFEKGGVITFKLCAQRGEAHFCKEKTVL